MYWKERDRASLDAETANRNAQSSSEVQKAITSIENTEQLNRRRVKLTNSGRKSEFSSISIANAHSDSAHYCVH